MEYRLELRREELIEVGAVDPLLLEVWLDVAVVGLEFVRVVELLERRWISLLLLAGMMGSETVRVEVFRVLMACCNVDLGGRLKGSSLCLSRVQ